MTNGEKFKEVFGFGADGNRVIAVNSTWWDCEFQNSKPMNDELGIYDDLPMADQSMVLSKTEKTTQEQPSHSPSLGYYYAFLFDETTGKTYMPKEE